MSRMPTTLTLVTASIIAGLAGCGGDDDTADPPTPTGATAATTALSSSAATGDLEAWCLGYWTSITGVDNPSVIPALEAEIEASVPGDLRETWDAQQAIPDGPASSEWRRLDSEIYDYFLANCDPEVGTPITQP